MRKLQKTRPSRKNLIKKADKLFSEIVRSKGKCEHCGKVESLQCAHVLSRTNKHLRWNEDNALCLCTRCHLFWAHKSPLEFSDWFKKNYPIRYGFLMREVNKLETNLGESLEFTIDRLNKRLKEI